MLLRCTSKFLNELGFKKTETPIYVGEFHPLDEWYAHLFYINHHKCIMFMNAQTRFSFVEIDIKREQLKSLEDIFRKGLSKALYEEEYPAETIKMFNNRIKSIEIAITIDRSVIGTMNRFIMEFKYMYTRDDRERNDSELGRQLRRSPVLNFGFPDKKMKELLLSHAKTS